MTSNTGAILETMTESTRIFGIFHEYTLLVPCIALFIAILLKGLIHSIAGKFAIHKMLWSGGMPSAHSTFVVALSTAIGIKHGVHSDYFMICLVFSIIVIYDAMNIRYQSGLHAKALNKLNSHQDTSLNESLGHTPLEACGGSIVGLSTAAILMFL